MTTIDLIDRQTALKKMCEMCYYHTSPDFVCRKCNVYELLAKQPTVEAKPVQHGHWIPLDGWFNRSVVKCSVCGNTLDMDGVNAGRGDANFCPNCGAKMDKGE